MAELVNPDSLCRGAQVAYIPMHAGDDINHPDVEHGFVSSYEDGKDFAFVRYWSKYSPNELRTKANSESTPIDSLYYHISATQITVDRLLRELYDG